MTATHSPKQILTAARNLIADPAHWTRETVARDKRGRPTEPYNPNACQFCALGALTAVFYQADPLACTAAEVNELDRAHEQAKRALRIAGEAGFGVNSFTISRVNDQLGHEATLKMFDAAIAALPD